MSEDRMWEMLLEKADLVGKAAHLLTEFLRGSDDKELRKLTAEWLAEAEEG